MPIFVDGSKLLQQVQIDMLKENIEEAKMLYKQGMERLKAFNNENFEDKLKLFDEGDVEICVYHMDDESIYQVFTSKDEFKEYVEEQCNKKKELEEAMKTMLSNMKENTVKLGLLQMCM